MLQTTNSTENWVIAERLREAAGLLEQQHANPYRVAAYRKAAAAVESMTLDIRALFQQEGLAGLFKIHGVGPQLASAIEEILRTGRWTQLERLRGSMDPEILLANIPGIGEVLAHRILETLHVDTLEDLETAAHDGRLARVPGFSTRRIAMVRAELAQMLSRGVRRPNYSAQLPTVDLLLDVDRAYRELATAGKLKTISPKRFNPRNESWLPIFHTERGPWQFTVMYSNTGLAHRLGRTHDWVVIFFSRDHSEDGQSTVVTESRGLLCGRRVVRGREGECEAHYHTPPQLSLGVA